MTTKKNLALMLTIAGLSVAGASNAAGNRLKDSTDMPGNGVTAPELEPLQKIDLAIRSAQFAARRAQTVWNGYADLSGSIQSWNGIDCDGHADGCRFSDYKLKLDDALCKLDLATAFVNGAYDYKYGGVDYGAGGQGRTSGVYNQSTIYSFGAANIAGNRATSSGGAEADSCDRQWVQNGVLTEAAGFYSQ